MSVHLGMPFAFPLDNLTSPHGGTTSVPYPSYPAQLKERSDFSTSTSVGRRAVPPTYPPGIFFTMGASRNYCEGGVDTSALFQSLSSFKGTQEPILCKVAGGDMNTLTKKPQNFQRVDKTHQQNNALGSMPAERNDASTNVQASLTSPPTGSQKRCRSTPKNDADSRESTEENEALVTSDSSGTGQGHITTLMLCNIPRTLSQERLVQVIDDLGFACMYNLVYIPVGIKLNLGYGFVNFLTPQVARSFIVSFDRFVFSTSSKRPHAQIANTQGLTETLAIIRRGDNFRKRGLAPLVFTAGGDVSVQELGVGPGGAFL